MTVSTLTKYARAVETAAGLIAVPQVWRPVPLRPPVCGSTMRPTGRIRAIGGIAWAR